MEPLPEPDDNSDVLAIPSTGFFAGLDWPSKGLRGPAKGTYWHNYIVAIRKSYVLRPFEDEQPQWSGIHTGWTQASMSQYKQRLQTQYINNLPPGDWSFRVRKQPQGWYEVQALYGWHENWNALLGTAGLLPGEHKFFRRFRAAQDKEEYMEIYLDWIFWTTSIDYPISPLDPVGLERLSSQPD